MRIGASLAAVVALTITAPYAVAEGIGAADLQYDLGKLGGDSIGENEAESYDLISLGGFYRFDVESWNLGFRVNAQISRNEGYTVPDNGDPDPFDNDQFMDYQQIEVHALFGPQGRQWTGFLGYLDGKVEDGDPGLITNVDRVEKYYFGVGYAYQMGDTDLFGRLGYTDTTTNNFNNEGGADFRQIRDGVFADFGVQHFVQDNWSVGGHVAGVFGEGSDSNSFLTPADYRGLFVEVSTEYRLTTAPVSFEAGLGYGDHWLEETTDPGDPDAETYTAYAYLGVRYWFGGGASNGSLKSARRAASPFDMPNYLAIAESSAVGNLN